MTGFIVAPGRKARPSDMSPGGTTCPFCPGSRNPPVVLASRVLPTGDSLLAVHNAFPILAPSGAAGVNAPAGLQEVIIEGTRHSGPLSSRAPDWLTALFGFWRDRMAAMHVAGLAHTIAFRNEGRLAGGTLQHPHSQIVGFEDSGALEWRPIDRLPPVSHCVMETDQLIAFIPEIPFSDLHTRIIPINQNGPFYTAGETTLQELGGLAASVLVAWKNVGPTPDHQVFISEDARGWQVDFVPCHSIANAFEVATAVRILSTQPVVLAESLRGSPVRRNQLETGRVVT